jgi:predicted nucleic acid-binding protein
MFRGIEHINLKMKLPQILDLKLNSKLKEKRKGKSKNIKEKWMKCLAGPLFFISAHQENPPA